MYKVILKNKWKNFSGQNPAAICENPDDLVAFAKEQQELGNFIVGAISYESEVIAMSFEKSEEFQLQNCSTEKIQFSPTTSKTEYNKAFSKVKNHIEAGDIYQMNLTYQLQAESKLSGMELFQRVMAKNSVDYLAYIVTPNFELICASPENFINIRGREIETSPIKGTRPRGENEQEDKEQIADLLSSEKEAAELNMITDLLRNDLGKVAKTGTVKLQEHRALSKCPTVWHTYSRITAELKKETHPLEALLSMFPGGSITGCPKKRARQIITEVEVEKRDFYTGCIFTLEANGDLDSSIIIRTIVKRGNKLSLGVGGGIVYDSKVEDEYKETLEKAKSFMNL
ncbi:anthranilate synthase component I family protein [Candidatus Peregrinibacteria bacterium]|jgi:para-aminobenzoate synthetase component I|nr:anthranilate synthase component I family protein [Candidatus Peregrinibacteria bacterium]MBT4631362.1 anthranilate synthase component I family protein [Candidatus Peregrinibacteria bacterium]MBT5517181.1 anthranilate synthase component I family protein [Candidatus Peregrinibacteria bacterium]MBT5823763.1 anthranilate synthase component I family protein [Candidatus Peregrinibacteria bacterium]